MARTMKRWMLNQPGRQNLKLIATEIPLPGQNEVLVRVSAVALNFRDSVIIEGGMGNDMPMPFTPGSDMAGVVEAVGPGTTRFSPGERVISTFFPGWIDGKLPNTARNPRYDTTGYAFQGVLAEYVVMNEAWLVKSPQSHSDAEASTLVCAGLTAWFALVERGGLRAGETVLIQGTGGVALFALQIAKAVGAEVFITSSSDEKLAAAKALGADHGINRKKENWVDAIHRLTGERGVDHVVDTVGGSNVTDSVHAVASHGRISLIGMMDTDDIIVPGGMLLLKSPIIQGIGVGHRRALEDLVRAVDGIRLKPVIDKTFGLGELSQALEQLDSGAFGKIVINAG
ncbi:NAD(P)-dependent alcohol dehydrogenase [Pantoea agglomerans]|uniref:zinc-dependent alcohol dehydrogenase family protein n=1 Tax=Enterobacter agglomerans TaxID=549 RepID=UPI0007E57E5B|nr:NAD(P)-dependent alcohol dehydrogenase [Pantoea agglomerans]WHU89970.1 NAD(P)-dependent alcohol dehydrogenase [Pantoea agglomerans pv. gypsophilae]WNN36634.1 NAD(P)-dependent alcohol dehydrogenase [Pantoea agglomerans]